MSHKFDDLDDAAYAALLALVMGQDPTIEHMGGLYAREQGLARTPTVSTGQDAQVGGTLRVPKGSLRGLFHNHPVRRRSGDGRNVQAFDATQTQFTSDDISMAKALKVPSYIQAGDRTFRYDPVTRKTEEVLAQIPMESLPTRLELAMNTPPKYR